MTHVRAIAASSFIFGATLLPGAAFAQCFNHVVGEIQLPKSSRNIPADAHVTARVLTSKGLLEARASRETRGVSQITLFLANRELKPVPSSQLRAETRRCDRQRIGETIRERIYAALSYMRTSIISEAEAVYSSRYGCNGPGTVVIKLVECWTASDGARWCSYRFSQGGRTCGWAIASNAN
jgi:hypothetical protein